MIKVRIAQEADIPQIRKLYLKVYGKNYPYKQFYDTGWLKKAVFSDDVLMLIARDSKSERIAGTASVVFDIGAYSDLVGEFGRLSVHPGFRKLGIGRRLMEHRIKYAEERLHVGLVATRVVHTYAQRISLKYGFVPVGFMPLKHRFERRESLALMVKYFGDSLTLRRNNPRIIPEVYPIASLVMNNLSLPCDTVVDEKSESYPPVDSFFLEEFTAKGLPLLLRIERGRVRNREIFGHMRLEYGFFKLGLGHANYLVARTDDHVAGAIGFTLDHVEHIVRVFELITSDEQAIWFLLSRLEQKCREEWGVYYIEVDVSAHATRMQRTLKELNFLPVAYIPAMVFHNVERLDIVRMVRLINLEDLGHVEYIQEVRQMADLVMRGFVGGKIAPKIGKAAASISLFNGLNKEQLSRLSYSCAFKEFEAGDRIFNEKEAAKALLIILKGTVNISIGNPLVHIGTLGKGETLGEVSLLTSSPHSAAATARSRVEVAILTHQDLSELMKLRPDIGVILYRNLAAGLGDKLLRSDYFLRAHLIDNKRRH